MISKDDEENKTIEPGLVVLALCNNNKYCFIIQWSLYSKSVTISATPIRSP
jgi:hypothetical protein